MEKPDQELLLTVVDENPRLKELYEEHLRYEKELAEFEASPARATWDEAREKRLKKQKLKGMDMIMSILVDYRHDSGQYVANQ